MIEIKAFHWLNKNHRLDEFPKASVLFQATSL
uniref:Uncharacterized protein n=1 Tax=Anguilla anguilla TaxID=7936 RepID=A0A0E9PMX3_ANGAN